MTAARTHPPRRAGAVFALSATLLVCASASLDAQTGAEIVIPPPSAAIVPQVGAVEVAPAGPDGVPGPARGLADPVPPVIGPDGRPANDPGLGLAPRADTPIVPVPGAPDVARAVPMPPTDSPPPLSAVAPPAPGGEAAPAAAGGAASTPSVSLIITERILPRAGRLAESSLTLQNSVVRYCVSQTGSARRELTRSFQLTIRDAAALIPLAFGSPWLREAPVRIITDASETAFSRDQMRAIVSGAEAPPRTLRALRQREPALMGLPALERLLLVSGASGEGSLDNRCILATTVVAHIHDTALGVRRTWARGELDAHWRDETTELADRLTLRDLIQGMINATDELSRSVKAFAEQAKKNPSLPFSERPHMVHYLDGLAEAITEQSRILENYTEEGEPTRALLQTIREAVAEGRVTLASASRRRSSASLILPFEAVQATVVGRVPEMFAFDPTAFERPNAPIQALRENLPTPVSAPADVPTATTVAP
ncbi:hypothetical protein [Acuticoccus kandeliae]|uniref:hypothetical protein n=1 Tax=Acuticoccus kandeliae TaxID=2073160 RepID=UPI000D3EC2E6|nr:hypothetical protein [Acuticoccus kandeliae]